MPAIQNQTPSTMLTGIMRAHSPIPVSRIPIEVLSNRERRRIRARVWGVFARLAQNSAN